MVVLGADARPHVVGIGASAGGLDALERFFDNVPKESGMAYVVVQHLSPDFKSLMDELLARHTELPIHLVEDGMAVEANHVYLIPPKKEMIISGGRLLLSDRDRLQELTLPIDVFLRSLAQDCETRAIAVILSGSGSDGSRGARDVYESGGLVVVQDVESAQFDGMPKSAIDAGIAHWVLPPERIPRVLCDHVTNPGPATASSTSPDTHGLQAVYRMLEGEFGIDFTHYKPSTVTRRIERRLSLAQSPDIEQYVQRLERDHDELDVLYRDLLIGVTRFFRDPEAFELLQHKILPDLLQRAPRDVPLRFWVAGCATGEEPYSLAIVLQDLMSKLGERPVKIFATDVHRASIERAGRALYEEEAIANVSAERLERYFLRVGSSYQVVPEIRQMVVFAHHNVMRDPPFTRVDFISCRNLLIYFQPAAQQKVLSLFHFALNRGGVMLLGPSESVGNVAHDFESVDSHWRIYRKHSDARTHVDSRLQPAAYADRVGFVPMQDISPKHSLSQLLGTYDALLDDVMPPSLLVSDQGELVHAFGGASRFLKPRDGRQGLEVTDMVDTELKMVLVGGLRRALGEASPLVFKGVRVEVAGEFRSYKVTIRRVRGRSGGSPHLLVSFEETDAAPRETRPPAREIDLDQVSRQQLAALESELGHTKENLQAAIEELETSNEELQASNEELHASNEELQSTNEELQSVNEELYTVNAEYQRKIGELTELTNDMDNLLSSTEVGTIFLDRELRIRKFTPQISETFHLLPHDVGRPIETFAHQMEHPELVDDLKKCLASGERVERELRDTRGKAFFLRILPYRVKGTIAGVVLTLIDATGLKAAEDALFHERYLLNSLLGTVPDAIYFADAAGKIIRMNPAMALRFGIDDLRAAVGKTLIELLSGDDARALHEQARAVVKSGKAEHYKLERRTAEDGSDRWSLVTRLPLLGPSGEIVGVGVIFRDVTDQKVAEQKIQQAVRRRDEFLAMLSHELRNPLGAIVNATSLLKGDGDGASLAPKAGPIIAILERQSKQMARLLDDLLDASRVTQNKVELRKQVVDLRAVVRDAADALRSQFEEHRIELTMDLCDVPLWIEGDPARLQQIHANLFSNAAKYTPAGGHVSVRAETDDDEAIVVVRDDGAGIPKSLLSSIFDLFVQSERTLDRAAGGLGVGLTLVRSLVTMHGGTVTAESDGDGHGSTFTVRLPLTQRAPEIARAGTPRAISRKTPKIVVVEDNADSRELLCALLIRAGYECESTDSGATAIALIDRTRPDVAILDLGLPVMDGFEIARHLRRDPNHADMFLIAISGYGRPADRAQGYDAGFDEHLVKPVDSDQLISVLETLASRREAGANAARQNRPTAARPVPRDSSSGTIESENGD